MRRTASTRLFFSLPLHLNFSWPEFAGIPPESGAKAEKYGRRTNRDEGVSIATKDTVSSIQYPRSKVPFRLNEAVNGVYATASVGWAEAVGRKLLESAENGQLSRDEKAQKQRVRKKRRTFEAQNGHFFTFFSRCSETAKKLHEISWLNRITYSSNVSSLSQNFGYPKIAQNNPK